MAMFLFILIEEAGVPVPIPGDFLMLLAGLWARQGRGELWQAVLVMEVATIVGASFLYLLSRRAGRGLVYRYGRYIRLTPSRLERAEDWLCRHGIAAVVLLRLVPGLRIATAIACGVLGVPYRVFLPGAALGGLLYILVYASFGYFLGPQLLGIVEHVHLTLGVLGLLVLLTLFFVWIQRARYAISRVLPPGG